MKSNANIENPNKKNPSEIDFTQNNDTDGSISQKVPRD